MNCLDENQLAAMASAPRDEIDKIESHLRECDSCRELVFALSGPEDKTAQDHRIGRFVVERELGRGAMGVVYLARDPELERKVALKLRTHSSRLDAEEEERQLREAKSLARLSHPNVVGVFEMGASEDTSFIVMEYIDGASLSRWIESETPNPREVLEVLVQVARGLQAAHSAKLVHRDVKPGNILVSPQGLAKVTDFGLVRAQQDAEEDRSDKDHQNLKLSQSGAVIGTPAYMAPELFAGDSATPRSDQFSLCVTAFEAITGARPFRGETFSELVRSIRNGRVDGSALSGISKRQRAAILRGLSKDPARRFASMDEFADELAPRSLRLPLAAGAVALVLATSFAWLGIRDTRSVDRCEGVGATIDEIWNKGAEQDVRSRFHEHDPLLGPLLVDEVINAIDARAREWKVARISTCEDTSTEQVQDPVAELRLRCLLRRESQLGEMVSIMRQAHQPEVLRSASEAVDDLPALHSCFSGDAANLEIDPPSERIAAEVEALEKQLDRVAILRNTGQADLALAEIKQIIPRARELDYPPTLARSLSSEARLHDQDKEFYEKQILEAIRIASQARMDQLVADNWLELILRVGLQAARYDDAMIWAQAADAVILRMGDPKDLRSMYLLTLSQIYSKMGRQSEAIEMASVGLELTVQSAGPKSSNTASAHNNLAIVLEKKDVQAAVEHYRKALTIWKELYGEFHPMVAVVSSNLSGRMNELGEQREARELVEHAIRVFEKSEPEGSKLAFALANLGTIVFSEKDFEKAEEVFERAHRQMIRSLGAEHPSTALMHFNLAEMAASRGELDKALPMYRESREMLQKLLGEDYHMIPTVLIGEGESKWHAMQDEAAKTDLLRARTIAEQYEDAPTLARTNLRLAIHELLSSADARRTRAFLDGTEDLDADIPPEEWLPSLALLRASELHLLSLKGSTPQSVAFASLLGDVQAAAEREDLHWDYPRDHAYLHFAVARAKRAAGLPTTEWRRWAKSAQNLFDSDPLGKRGKQSLKDWLAEAPETKSDAVE